MKFLTRSFLTVSLSITLSNMVYAADEPVTAAHILEIQLKLTDQGPGFKSDGDNVLEAGESGALKFLVVNYGNLLSPDINLLMSSSFAAIDGLYVELPGLAPGEGVEFDTQLEIPPGTDLSYIELSAEMFDKGDQPLADKFEWKIINGALLAATEVTGDNAAITATAYAAMATRPGTIKGVVIDIENGAGLAADIIVRESKSLFKADANGYFAIDVSAGMYTLSFNHSGKRERIIEGIRVEGGSATVVDVVLEPKDSAIAGLKGAGSVQEVVVQTRADKTKASVQLVIRQKAPVVSDRLSSEEMSRAADSTAAKAVQRAVGASVVGGKYIYVRGLGERYSYTTLNGAKLPSPEPNQKVVPLDIFPTSVIADVSIVKTASADLPADFAGGSVRVQTKEFPEEFGCKIGLGLGYTASSTGKNILSYDGGNLDWLGFDDGTRAVPDTIPQDARLSSGAAWRGGALSDEDMVLIAREFNNDFSLKRRTAPIDLDGSATCGDTVELGQRPLGYLASVKLGNSFEREFQIRRTYTLSTNAAGEPELLRSNDFNGETGVQKAKLSGLANLNYSIAKGHSLDIVSLLTSTSSDEARFLSGFENNYNGNLDYASLRFVRRMLSYNQLSGSHDFGKAIVDWNGSYSLALRDEPDWRELVRTHNEANGQKLWLPKSSSGSHYWSDLREPVYGGGIDVTLPFLQWQGLESSVKLGSGASGRDRDFEVRRLRFIPLTGVSGDYYTLEPSELFADEQIGTAIKMEETTRPLDSYEAAEQVYHGYAMADVPLVEKFRLIPGVRYEHSDISVTTFDPFTTVATPTVARLKNDDVLPSLNTVYAIRDGLNFRASASQTLARPDFRELSPFALADFYGGQELIGNPNLQQTKIWNADLRAEWFPGEGEILSASLFFKHFIDPIEQVIIPSSQQSISFENAEGAVNYGIEIEARRNLAFIDAKLRPLYLGGNLTWLKSRVDLDPNSGVQTRSERPLQGQSDLLANVVGGVDFDKYVFQLSYNTFSKRIAQVGAFGLPDIFEAPFHSLNATYTQKFAEGWSFGVSLENLLDEAEVLRQGGQVVERNYQGISGGAGIDFEF